MTFVINGKEYNLTSAVLTMDNGKGNGQCLLAVYPMDWSGMSIRWTLGAPFIRQWCNIHDVQNLKLGLAPALPVLQLQKQAPNSDASSTVAADWFGNPQ